MKKIINPWRNHPDFFLMNRRIVVLPEYRHQGLGTLIVQEAEKWAKELGFMTAVVESRDNKIHFYETMGYVADYSQKIISETFTCYKMEKQLKGEECKWGRME